MYRYEMHQHSNTCSACAQVPPAQVVEQLHQAGYAGMVLTDHFFHGNTCVRRHAPWDVFVRAYEEAWLEAKEAGDRLDFDVLFGIEEGVGGGKEVLLYGITPDTLYAHPEMCESPATEAHLLRLASIVREAGGLMFQAHPFRNRDYIRHPWQALPADCLDGIEAYNAGNVPLENARAIQYAQEMGLPIIAGTDAHFPHQPVRYGIQTPHRLRTNADLIAALRQQNYTLYLGKDA